MWQSRSIKQATEEDLRESNCYIKERLCEEVRHAFWAYQIAFKTHVEFSPYQLIYVKSCHLPGELEHKAFWVVQFLNFDKKMCRRKMLIKLDELKKMQMQAYENFMIHKERPKDIMIEIQ